MKANNTIHINGKLYDARTGKLLSDTNKPSAKKPPKKPATAAATSPKPAARQGSKFVDGFSRHPLAKAPSIKTPAATKKVVKANNVSSGTKAASTVSAVKKTHSPHTINPARRGAKRSATLHRTAVKAPLLAPETPALSKQVERKTAQTSVARAQHAKTVQRSSLISRFGSPQTPIKNTEPATQESTLSLKNIAEAAEKARRAHSMHRVKNELIAKTLAEANAQATHRKKVAKVNRATPKRPRGLQLATAGLAALVLAAYVAYLNVPALSMKVASSRAGFAATLPGQAPAGYSLQGPIAYSPGQVIINFGSHTDDRRFSIQQQPTTWDSEALKNNYVAKVSKTEPITYQDSGLTIYLYNEGDAAWVSDGKFYSIKAGNAQLDSRQILAIATSM